MSFWLHRLCVSVRTVSTVGRSRLKPRTVTAQHALSPRWHVSRSLSVSPGSPVNYEELKNLLKNDEVVLIDVREPWEIKEYGIIKGSVNIPLGDLVSALQLASKEFEDQYHKKLPEKSNTLVFSCLAGIRSAKAIEVAVSLGYSRVHHYAGGFEDWNRHEQPQKPK